MLKIQFCPLSSACRGAAQKAKTGALASGLWTISSIPNPDKRKYETRNTKFETNPKFQNSNVSNDITDVTKLKPIPIFVNACLLVFYKDANKDFAQFTQN